VLVKAGVIRLAVHHLVLVVRGACITMRASLLAVMLRASFDFEIAARFDIFVL